MSGHCEDRVRDGPASGEEGSKGRNKLDCIRAHMMHACACDARDLWANRGGVQVDYVRRSRRSFIELTFKKLDLPRSSPHEDSSEACQHAAVLRLRPGCLVISSDTMFLLISFRKSTPPQNHQLIVDFY